MHVYFFNNGFVLLSDGTGSAADLLILSIVISYILKK
jgi:hypothetical protein